LWSTFFRRRKKVAKKAAATRGASRRRTLPAFDSGGRPSLGGLNVRNFNNKLQPDYIAEKFSA